MLKNLRVYTTALFLFGLFLVSFSAQGQVGSGVQARTKVIGSNTITGEPISAKEYIFSKRVHNFQIDSINNCLSIQLRGVKKDKWLDNKGKFIQFDLDSNKVLWSKYVDYHSEYVESFGGVALHVTAGKSYCLDNETGQESWEVKNSLIFADIQNKIGIGYKLKSSNTSRNTVEGIDLRNGSIKWERMINRNYGWNGVLYLNDSTLMIVAYGLHTINIFDGTGWDITTLTGKIESNAAGFGVLAGVLLGVYSTSPRANVVSDVVSNVIVDSLDYCFASRQHILKLDKKGELLWKTDLPLDLTSSSQIFKTDSSLVMINKGFAIKGAYKIDFGTPFIASFDLETGEQNYLETISDKYKEMINGSVIKDNEIVVLFKDRISNYSIADGSLLSNKAFKVKEHGELRYLVDNQVYVQTDSLFLSLSQLDSTKYYMYTDEEKILILDSSFIIQDEIRTDEVYVNYLKKDGMKFISKGSEALVIDSNGVKRAELPSSSEAVFLKDKMYFAEGQSLLEVDIKNVFSDETEQ